MQRYRFYTADVFTDRPFSGNQLAIFPEADEIPDAELSQITREFNLSETIFIYPADNPAHTRKVRIFTPGRELPFAGHPTVGAAIALAQLGFVPALEDADEATIVFEEGVGPVPIRLRRLPGQAMTATFTAAKLPEFGPVAPAASAIAPLIGLQADDLLDGAYAPQYVSCGVPFLIIPVRDRAALAKAYPDLANWNSLFGPDSWAPEVYVIAFDENDPNQLYARMFAPALGIIEDPATGAAATALGGYLGSRENAASGTFNWLIHQGIEMGRPSQITLEVERSNGSISAVRVGGSAVLMSEGTLLL